MTELEDIRRLKDDDKRDQELEAAWKEREAKLSDGVVNQDTIPSHLYDDRMDDDDWDDYVIN